METIKYGIIGAGYWAQNLARSLKSVGLNFAGFFDIRLEAKIENEVRFLSKTELFNGCDAVIIATPPETHYELTNARNSIKTVEILEKLVESGKTGDILEL